MYGWLFFASSHLFSARLPNLGLEIWFNLIVQIHQTQTRESNMKFSFRTGFIAVLGTVGTVLSLGGGYFLQQQHSQTKICQ